MLVLTRQRDESIMIGDDIEVMVVDIRGDKVRLGIRAPSVIPVHRLEVHEQIRSDPHQRQPSSLVDLLREALAYCKAMPCGDLAKRIEEAIQV